VSAGEPGPDPKEGRFDLLSRALTVAMVFVTVLAAAAVVLPGRVGDVLGGGAAVLLVGVPLARVLWLGQRWIRRGDLRFGLVALSVLGIVAMGAVLA
jgi:hypothetical protein